MLQPRRPQPGILAFVCHLFTAYALIITLCAPFSLHRIEARAAVKKAASAATSTVAAAATVANPATLKKAKHRDGEMIVRFRQGVSDDYKNLLATSKGGRRKGRLRGRSNLERLELPADLDIEQLALALRQLPEIELAEPNYLVERADTTPDDARLSEQWALHNTGATAGSVAGADIRALAAWDGTTGAASTVVAIVDSGIDFTHPDLQSNRWTNAGEQETSNNTDDEGNGYTDDRDGWDWVAGDNDPRDEQGHGTMVAGIIAAEGNNATGIAGVMWRAGLMNLRVLDNTGTGDVANAVEAIDYAVANGARVINCSWGTDGESVALREAVERAAQANVVVVASAGNSARDTDVAAHYPASYRISNVIGVAASDAADNLAAFSNWGATSVGVAAPGKDILTTRMGGGYTTMQGTSAAAPMVAGIAGLIKTERWWLSGGGTRQAIVDGARSSGGLTGKVSAGGVADAAGALAALQGPNTPPPGSGSGGSVTPPPSGGGGSGSPSSPPQGGASVARLPNLDEARRRQATTPIMPQPIKADRPPRCSDYHEPPADCDDFDDPPSSTDPLTNDPRYSNARTEPQNQTGQPGVDLGSRNFNWSANLVGLAGRAGMNLDVTLHYNSLVWTKQGTGITFNADKGFPAPGFSLGLPKIQPRYYHTQTATWSYLIVTPAGGRVRLPQVGTSNIYEAVDGSFMQLIDGAPKVARTSDGTQYIFGHATSDGGALCTEIKDRNGNYVSISHDALGRISTMTDTLGRIVNFIYDANGNLEKITQQRGADVYTWATFGYGDLYMKVNFPGLTVYGPHNTHQNVLTQVGFPDGSRYYFTYNTWGQVKTITRFGADGTQLAYTDYNLPLDDAQGQSDCPRFTTRRDWITGGIRGADGVVETRYSTFPSNPSDPNSPVDRTEVTQVGDPSTPNDDVTYKEFFAVTGWQNGLTRASETWANGIKQKWTTTLWTQDDESLLYQKNPRVTETNIYDVDKNHRRTTIGYTPDAYRLPQDVREWGGKTTDAALGLFRRTHTTYNLHPAYTSRRMIGLVESVRVYDGEGDTQTGSGLVAKTVNSYDWGGGHLVTAGATTTQHDAAYTESFTEGRGNLVAVENYDVNAPNDANRRTAQYIGYDTNGSPVFTAARHYAHRTNIAYDDDFKTAADNGTRRAYPTKVTDPDGFVSKTQYDYHTGNVTRTEDPKGAAAATDYDLQGRVARVTNVTNGAYTRYVYAPAGYYVDSFTTASAAGQELHGIQVFDGAGRLSAAATEMPGSAGHSAVRYEYDWMGRRVRASNPTEVAGGWVPAGDDAPTSSPQVGGWQWTGQEYDWQGRPTVTTDQGGRTTEANYGGCGCAGGEQVTVKDQSGRRKRLTKDTLGRLVKTEELNWGGESVYSSADYTYNARDQLTLITRAGELPRTLEYDGHGRLWKRTTPEQGATTYTYYDDNAVQFITDARGARTEYRYNNRGLPVYIEFTHPSGVASRTNIAFDYDASGNRKWMAELGFGRVDYEYDTLSQLKSETRAFDGVAGAFKLEYGYDLGGRLTSVTNPWGITVGYPRDKAGRIGAVTNTGYGGFGNYTNDIRYRAFGGVKSKAMGNGLTFTASYDNRLRVTGWSVPLADGGGMGAEYAYDNFGENTGRVTYAKNLYDGSLDRSYQYDHVGRLVYSLTGGEARHHALGEASPAQPDGDYAHGLAHDARGNITLRTGWGGTSAMGAATYNARNQRDGQSHDAAGNMTSDGYTSFAYDATGREASASSGVSHTYDGDLMRVKRVENGVTTLYLRSSILGGAIIAEMNAQGSWTRGYVYGESGNLTAIQQPEGYVEWVTQDPVTKGQRITNSQGKVTAALEFDPFGGETSKSYNSYRQPQKYTTYTRDSNGTDDAMHRRYIAYWSRFQQPDPYDGSYNLTDPQSFNRYAYTQNDPVNFVDPSGLNMSWGVGCVSVDEGRTWQCDAGTSLFGGSVFGRVVETGYNPSGTREPRSPREPREPTDKPQDGFPGGSPNPLAQLGPCAELVVPEFGGINQAASTLLQNTYGKGAEAAYGRLNTYEKAVFLNTSAAAASVGVNLSNAKFDGFYLSNKPGNLPYGMYITGASGKLEGRHAAIGSVELDTKKGRTQMDVDLYKGGLRGAMGKHGEEVNFNNRHNRPTHPGDVASQLRARGVNSGVSCRN